MIESVMFFGIGFLVAALLGLVLIPLVHNRAVRLTMRRVEAATPFSMAEIQADKDHLRAEFAMSTRRLEMTIEQLRDQTISQLADLGKKSDAINRLKAELSEKTAAIVALEAREQALREQLKTTETELAAKINALSETERALSEKQSELAKATAALDEQTVTADSQRVELVALRTKIEVLKDNVAEHEKAAKEMEQRLEHERTNAVEASKKLTEERSQVELLEKRLSEIQQQLVAQTTEAEVLGRRVQELETRLADQGRVLGERNLECSRLQSEIAAAQKVEAGLRAEVADFMQRHKTAAQNLLSDKARLAEQLARSEAEQARVARELGSLKQEIETAWAGERVENAVLRERITEVAAEVAHLTMSLEGPLSPIEAILANEGSANGDREILVNGDGEGTLGDRIRALRSRAARVPSN